MERQPPPTASEERLPDWSALPDLPLECIAHRLRTLKDLLSFRGVCTSWRVIGRAVEGGVQALQSPLFYGEVYTTSFYHLAEKRVYKINCLIRNGQLEDSIAGFSHGHLIRYHVSCVFSPSVSLSNPVTCVENRRFPCAEGYYLHASWSQALLSSPLTSPGCVLVVYSTFSIHYRTPGGEAWFEVRRLRAGDHLCQMYGVATVGEKGYVLIDGLALATFDFTENPELAILNAEHILRPGLEKEHCVFFAESKGELFLFLTRELSLAQEFAVFRFDTSSCRWVRSDSLGGCAVFVGGRKKGRPLFVDNFAEWGGSKDCIYFFDAHTKWIVEYKVKDGKSNPFLYATENPDINYHAGIWVLPSLS